MEDLKKKDSADLSDREIVYSQSIKAGKRIYYLDVKKNRKDEMFLTITESKKIVSGEGDDSQVSFEKHKIFLYKEDFDKFTKGLQQAVSFIEEQQGACVRADDEESHTDKNGPTPSANQGKSTEPDSDIKIDIDF